MVVDDAVDVADQPLAIGHHLARAFAEERLVGCPQVVTPDVGQKQDRGEEEHDARRFDHVLSIGSPNGTLTPSPKVASHHRSKASRVKSGLR